MLSLKGSSKKTKSFYEDVLHRRNLLDIVNNLNT